METSDQTDSLEIWREGGAMTGRWAFWLISGMPEAAVIRLVVWWTGWDGLKQLSSSSSNPRTRLR